MVGVVDLEGRQGLIKRHHAANSELARLRRLLGPHQPGNTWPQYVPLRPTCAPEWSDACISSIYIHSQWDRASLSTCTPIEKEKRNLKYVKTAFDIRVGTEVKTVQSLN